MRIVEREYLQQDAKVIAHGRIPFSRRTMEVFHVDTWKIETERASIVLEAPFSRPEKRYEGKHRTLRGALKAAIETGKAQKALEEA